MIQNSSTINFPVTEGSSEEIRAHTLQCAKNFKTSWVELGRALYAVSKDKLYRNWGYTTFDAFVTKEINIRKLTAMKLLRSYYFLEKEEPQYLKDEYEETADASSVPSYEAIDVLRLAKNKKTLDNADYQKFKASVLQKGKDAREVKKDLTALIRQREELSPEDAREKRKESSVKRLLTVLRSLKTEIETSRILPHSILKDVKSLIDRLEVEIKS